MHWWKEARIYELYVDTFAGSFKGLIEHLDYIHHLGINTVHILPHYPSPMIDGGYDVLDYRNVRTELGTLHDFEAFVKAAHDRGIRVMTDMVLNHVSSAHPWFTTARSSTQSPGRDFFLWSTDTAGYSESWNAFPDIKESNWIFNPDTGDYYYATFYPDQPDLNWDNPHVYEAMLEHMDFWARLGVDGFRLDAALTLIKRDGVNSKGLPETHDILKRIRRHLDSTYDGQVALLAESHMQTEDIAAFFAQGDECHLAYHFPMAEAIFLSLAQDSMDPMHALSARSHEIPANCAWVPFLRNHDELSLSTLSAPERRAVIDFLDPSHRYLFNRGTATSIRLGSAFKERPEHYLRALEMLYSAPGSPMLYSGDEIGMENLSLPSHVRDTRISARGAFDWARAQSMLQNPDSLTAYCAMQIKHSNSVHSIHLPQAQILS